jgi:hypothetical protein
LNAPADEDLDAKLSQLLTEPEPVKKPNFFQRLFGKKDTVAQKTEKMLKEEEQQRIDAIEHHRQNR